MNDRPSNDYVRREAGILLHVTSLPAPHGIGDLGRDALDFVDFLRAAGQKLWQILPLTPLGHGNSPYASHSAMAGNPLLISLQRLADEGLLAGQDLAEDHGFPIDRVDYDSVAAFKLAQLRRAHHRFRSEASAEQKSEFDTFCGTAASWLEDFSLFMALKDAHHGALWLRWEPELVNRHPEAIDRSRRDLAESVDFHKFVQFQFARQWSALRAHANSHGVRIIGDIPIFVALDSSDVWSHQDLFYLDAHGRPTVVAGVPPDYFSKTGQRWGNPLYRWDTMSEQGYGWWIERIRNTLTQVDIVRIDHFRGFEAYWEIPAENRTAEVGRWVKGPGEAFFRAVEGALGPLPVIAENLGLITPEVEELRLSLGYPGMAVLHFAFDGGPTNPYLPHNYEKRCVGYTGTHDNDTTVGWFNSRTPSERERVRRYMGTDREINWDLMRLLSESVADMAVVPLQDVLELGTEARMNMPGQPDGNWGWRLSPDRLTVGHAERLLELSELYGRGIEPE
jgi:4-alpha-glucanotransferase